MAGETRPRESSAGPIERTGSVISTARPLKDTSPERGQANQLSLRNRAGNLAALVVLASLWPGASAVSVAQENPAIQASRLESQGRFLEAAAVLRLALERTS